MMSEWRDDSNMVMRLLKPHPPAGQTLLKGQTVTSMTLRKISKVMGFRQRIRIKAQHKIAIPGKHAKIH